MGVSGILTQRGKSIADLMGLLLPGKGGLGFRGLGDTETLERVNGGEQRNEDRQTDQTDGHDIFNTR